MPALLIVETTLPPKDLLSHARELDGRVSDWRTCFKPILNPYQPILGIAWGVQEENLHNGVMTIMSVGDSAQVVPSGSDAHPRKPVPALGCFPPATDRAAPLFFALTYNLFSSSLLISPDPPFGQLLLKSILIYPPSWVRSLAKRAVWFDNFFCKWSKKSSSASSCKEDGSV